MTARIRTPPETWALIEPLFAQLGITRIGDITGLDRIGIPVWIAVRPNSRTLSVSQGKGITPWAAKVSAAMECVEIALAERPSITLEFATATGLASRHRLVDVDKIPQPVISLYGTRRPIFWAESRDWRSDRPVLVPYEIVHADATLPWLSGSGSFLPSTNGLASGNNRDEAIHHALCEVIERDSVALWEHLPPESQNDRRLDLESISDPLPLGLLDQLINAEIIPIVWDVTTDIGVAAFRAVIVDGSSDPVTYPSPAAFGAGCHPNKVIALVRALTEAAQSRLTVISGSRDDFGRRRYADTQSFDALTENRRLADKTGTSIQFNSVPHRDFDSFAASIDYIAGRLAAVGLPEILLVDLSDSNLPINVVRAIVPGLEGPSEAAMYRPGDRAKTLMMAAAA